ncbi:MAG TPA: hypothetical protein VG797_05860 [Phycisphaerales bacterium]|nr:hypothetical protein [Phycisphaerales bacterium]
MFRTRRRWIALPASLILFLLAMAAAAGQQVIRYGFVKAVPNVAYITLFPDLAQKPYLDELTNRIYHGDLARWETSMLVRRCVRVIEARKTEPMALQAAADTLCRIEVQGKHKRETRPWRQWITASDAEPERAIDSLISLLQGPDDQTRRHALNAIRQFTDRGTRAFPALLGLTLDPSPAVSRDAVGSMTFLTMHGRERQGACYFDDWVLQTDVNATPTYVEGQPSTYQLSEPTTQFIRSVTATSGDISRCVELLKQEGLHHEKTAPRVISIFGLTLLAPADTDARDRVFELADDPAPEVRRAVVESVGVFPFAAQGHNIFDRALDDDNSNVRSGVTRTLHVIDPDIARVHIDKVRALVESADDWAAEGFTQLLLRFVGNGPLVASTLSRILQEKEGVYRRIEYTLQKFTFTDSPTPELLPVFEPYLDPSVDAPVRASAAAAFLWQGGDPDRAFKILLSAMEDDNKTGQGRNDAVAQAMFRVQECDRLPIRLIEGLLKETDPTARKRGVWFAYGMGLRAAPLLPLLRQFTSDPDQRTAGFAKETIEYLEDAADHGAVVLP